MRAAGHMVHTCDPSTKESEDHGSRSTLELCGQSLCMERSGAEHLFSIYETLVSNIEWMDARDSLVLVLLG